MRQYAIFAAIGLALAASPALAADDKGASAQAEKEKALKNPYPNDFGPESVDVSKYGPELQAGYQLLQAKCARCHNAARPLNSQFVDAKPEEIQAWKQSNPEMFQDKAVWQIESGIWQRYVKRMMAKPGCNIADAEGKKIFRFLSEDSKLRKTGARAAAWAAQRRKLLSDFKAKYPEKYKELFGAK